MSEQIDIRLLKEKFSKEKIGITLMKMRASMCIADMVMAQMILKSNKRFMETEIPDFVKEEIADTINEVMGDNKYNQYNIFPSEEQNANSMVKVQKRYKANLKEAIEEHRMSEEEIDKFIVKALSEIDSPVPVMIYSSYSQNAFYCCQYLMDEIDYDTLVDKLKNANINRVSLLGEPHHTFIATDIITNNMATIILDKPDDWISLKTPTPQQSLIRDICKS